MAATTVLAVGGSVLIGLSPKFTLALLVPFGQDHSNSAVTGEPLWATQATLAGLAATPGMSEDGEGAGEEREDRDEDEDGD